MPPEYYNNTWQAINSRSPPPDTSCNPCPTRTSCPPQKSSNPRASAYRALILENASRLNFQRPQRTTETAVALPSAECSSTGSTNENGTAWTNYTPTARAGVHSQGHGPEQLPYRESSSMELPCLLSKPISTLSLVDLSRSHNRYSVHNVEVDAIDAIDAVDASSNNNTHHMIRDTLDSSATATDTPFSTVSSHELTKDYSTGLNQMSSGRAQAGSDTEHQSARHACVPITSSCPSLTSQSEPFTSPLPCTPSSPSLDTDSAEKVKPFIRRRYSQNSWDPNSSAIPLMSSSLRIPTCFRIGELLPLVSGNSESLPYFAIELYAVISDTKPNLTPPGHTSEPVPHIMLADIFFPKQPPYVLAVCSAQPNLLVPEPDRLAGIANDKLHDDHGTDRLIRAIVRPLAKSRRLEYLQQTPGDAVHGETAYPLNVGRIVDTRSIVAQLEILSIEPSDWDEVNVVRKIVDPEI